MVQKRRFGNGFRLIPAPVVEIERYTRVDDHTAAKQVIRVNYDGREKVVSEEQIALGEDFNWVESPYWATELVQEEGDPGHPTGQTGFWIVQTQKPYFQHRRQRVVDTYEKDVNGQPVTKIDWAVVENINAPHQRRFRPKRIWIEPRPSPSGSNPSREDWVLIRPAKAVFGWRIRAAGVPGFLGQGIEGEEEVSVTLNHPDHANRQYNNKDWFKWEELPQDLRQAYLARFKPCRCRRERYDRQEHDRCYLCRAHYLCSRCGKDQYFGEEAVANAGATGESLYCHQCRGTLAAEARVANLVLPEHRQALVAEAQALLAGMVVDGEEAAQACIKRVLERRFVDNWSLGQKVADATSEIKAAISNQAGYWNSPLSKGQLWRVANLLEQEPAAALVTTALVASSTVRHYGKSTAADRLTEQELQALVAKLDAGEPVLARRVAESDQVEAEAQIAEVQTKLGQELESSDPVRLARAKVEKAVQAATFTEAKELAAEALVLCETRLAELAGRQAQIDAGELLPDVEVYLGKNSSRDPAHVWVVSPVGDIIAHQHGEDLAKFGDLPASVLIIRHQRSNYGYTCLECWEVVHRPRNLTQAQRQFVVGLETDSDYDWYDRGVNVHQYFRGQGTGWDLSRAGAVVYQTPYFRDFAGADKEALDEMRAAMPVDVERYEQRLREPEEWEAVDETAVVMIVGPYQHRDPRQVRLLELRQELEVLQQEVDGLEHIRKFEAGEQKKARRAAADRNKASEGTRPVAHGDVFKVTFTEETHRGESRLSVGPFWDDPSETWVKLVEHPYSGPQPQAGVRCLVQVVARNSEQIHLFRYKANLPKKDDGKVWVWGYFAVPVRSPADYDREIDETQARIAEVRAEIAQIEAGLEESPPQDASQSAVAAQAVDEVEEPYGDEGEPQTAMAAAFAARVNKK